MKASAEPLRDRFNAFVASHEVAWELVMAALAAAFLVVGFVADENASGGLVAVELALTIVFLLEFVARFAAAHDRGRYLRSHWIDVVAIIPPARGFRLLRLLRLLRLVRMFAGVYRSLAAIEHLARHRGLLALFFAWLAVAGICASALYLAESGINPAVKTPLDALWWGVTTLTTVGYGDIYPMTPEGRLAGAALMLLGITLFATITGTITSILVSGRHDDMDLPAQLEQLARLHETGALTEKEFVAGKALVLRYPGRAASTPASPATEATNGGDP